MRFLISFHFWMCYKVDLMPFQHLSTFPKNNSFPRLKFIKKMLSTAIFKYDITTSELYRQSLSFYALFNLKFIIRVNNTVYWICDQRKQFKCNSNFISLNRSNHIVERCSWYVCFARKKENQWNQHQFCALFSLIPLQAFYKNVNNAQSYQLWQWMLCRDHFRFFF